MTMQHTATPARPGAGRPVAGDPPVLAEPLGALRRAMWVLVGVGFFLNLLVLTTPIYMTQVFDRVLSTGHYETLLMVTLIAFVALAVHGTLDAVRAAMLNRTAQWLEGRLGAPVMEASVGRAIATGTPGEGFRDLALVRQTITGSGYVAALDAPWVPLFIILLYLVHPMIGTVALLAAIALFSLALINDRATRAPLSKAGEAQMVRIRMAESAARNAQVVRAMGLMPNLVARWVADGREQDALSEQAGTRAAIISGFTRFVRMAVQVGLLGLGAYLVLERELTPGGMIAASVVLGRALAPVEQAIQGWRSLVAARSALGRLRALLTHFGPAPAGQTRTRMPAPEGAVALNGVTLVPPGATRPVLQGVSLTLRPGTITAILGPSAAGKSSLCRVLAGIWPPSAGQVLLDGVGLDKWHPEDLGPHLGYLPQEVELFPATVRENIARLGTATDEQVVAAAKLAGVHEMIAALPQGYDTPLGDGGMVLSGGQRQRIGLARALFGSPAIVVLDEPNANLDSDGERALMQTLSRLKDSGVTVVLVAHRRAVLQVVDSVALLDAGRLLVHGPRDRAMEEISRMMRSKEAGASRPTLSDSNPRQPQNVA